MCILTPHFSIFNSGYAEDLEASMRRPAAIAANTHSLRKGCQVEKLLDGILISRRDIELLIEGVVENIPGSVSPVRGFARLSPNTDDAASDAED